MSSKAMSTKPMSAAGANVVVYTEHVIGLFEIAKSWLVADTLPLRIVMNSRASD